MRSRWASAGLAFCGATMGCVAAFPPPRGEVTGISAADGTTAVSTDEGGSAVSGATATSDEPSTASTAADPADSTDSGATSSTSGSTGVDCDPLVQTCGAEETCLFYEEVFQCLPDSSGRYGQAGEQCEFANVCDPGLFCSLGWDVVCLGGFKGCCTPYCDLEGPASQCPEGTCVPHFPDGSPFPELEHLGYCDSA